jgi:hypothetical protein
MIFKAETQALDNFEMRKPMSVADNDVSTSSPVLSAIVDDFSSFSA